MEVLTSYYECFNRSTRSADLHSFFSYSSGDDWRLISPPSCLSCRRQPTLARKFTAQSDLRRLLSFDFCVVWELRHRFEIRREEMVYSTWFSLRNQFVRVSEHRDMPARTMS
ncbi:hypothetical protein Droror1_Dr00022698 [Drosera rotundifolia]